MSTDDPVFVEGAWERRAGGRFLNYCGPVLRENLSPTSLRSLLTRERAWGARWSYDWDNGIEGPWYSIICDDPNYDIEVIKRKVRYYVRRALKRTDVRPVEISWLAEHAYDTHRNAATRYTGIKVGTPESFRSYMQRVAVMEGFRGFGAFIEGALAAYGLVREWDRQAQFRVAKFDPAFNDVRPMYALYFEVTRCYLRERNFLFIDNGTRPLYHDTNMEDFLLSLNWRRAYCRADLFLKPVPRLGLKIARTARPVWRRLLSPERTAMVESLLMADEMARLSRSDAAQSLQVPVKK